MDNGQVKALKERTPSGEYTCPRQMKSSRADREKLIALCTNLFSAHRMRVSYGFGLDRSVLTK